MNGRTLNNRWNVNAKHPLYNKTGKWYHKLNRFPGVLFDENGYLLFETSEDFYKCEGLSINQDVWVPKGISAIPDYIKVVTDGDEHIPSIKKSTTSEAPKNVHYEGAPVSVNLTRYERDRTARDECLKHYGHSCIICGFNFEETYGKIAHEMIHVHHLLPIGDIGHNYVVDPIKDMRPVCPNCHAVIHKRKPPFEIDDVNKMMMNIQINT